MYIYKNLRIYIYAQTNKYNGGAPYLTIYKMLIGCYIYAILDMLAYACPVLIVSL